MTTRPIIRTRPGAGFITVLASLAILNILVLAAGCSSDRKTASSAPQQCASDNGGLTLPDGFCATVFADSIGHARHLVVASNGTVYVNTWSGTYYGNDTPHSGGFLVALRDTTGDGKADVISRFGDSAQSGGHGGTGIALYKGTIYAESNDKIVGYDLPADGSVPSGAGDIILSGLPLTGDHPMHPFAIDGGGSLYVDLGSATNACQFQNRIALSKGHQPCTELETRAGVWRYDANRTGQKFSPAERYATGIRNADGIAVDSTGRGIYSTQHGRDQLGDNWPKLYTTVQGAAEPAEELLRVEQSGDYGWPECYFDSAQKKLVLAPEYGGDGGKAIGPCAGKKQPIATFPAHWAPNDLTLYNGRMFPARYRGGAFIAFHGSWNRAPLPQAGYNVVFVPFSGGNPTGQFEIFANGFAPGTLMSPAQAAHRPSGVAVGPSGELYVSDDVHGRIWRVVYTGQKNAAQSPASQVVPQAAPTPLPPEGIHPDAGAQPDSSAARSRRSSSAAALAAANITPAMVALGDSIYSGKVGGGTCAGCHGADAKGSTLAPDLTSNKYLWGDGSYASILGIIKQGVAKPKQHAEPMPPMGGAQLSQAQLAAVAAYVWSLSHT
jgi:glucose/arabinose dehydrogenase/mono/diheme cytochrome c family protein